MDFANYTAFIDSQISHSFGLGAQATDVTVALIIVAVFAVLARITA